MRIVTVLKSGGDFKPSHVQALQRQVEKWAPLASFECLTDVDVPGVETVPLVHKWPGWWSKMELFRPDFRGDFLFMDLDTVIVGPLDDFEYRSLTILRDFYRDGTKLKEGLQSSLMYLPEASRQGPWDDFNCNPALSMMMHRYGGDQKLLEGHYINRAARWQDVLPGQVVSWKVGCKNGIVPPEANIVCFHGKPRPWQVGPFLHLYRE